MMKEMLSDNCELRIMNSFQTPCGILRCTDSAGGEIPFQAVPLEKSYQTAVYDLISEEWIPVKPAYQAEIRIDTGSLPVGETLNVRLDSDLTYRFGASDENAVCNVVTENGFSLSLGAYDPNDDGKDRQAVPVLDENGVRIGYQPPAQYDTAAFTGYLLTVLPDWSGFSVRLLDRTVPQILFRIAWIRHLNEPDIEAEPDDYERAVTLITTF